MKDEIQQNIEAYSENNKYNFDNRLLLSSYARRVIELMNKDARTLLECGIGHGYSSVIFEEYFNDYIVIDADKKLIANYCKQHPDTKIKFINTYFEDYEGTEKFDVIVLGFVLEHVMDPVKIIERMLLKLKDNGQLFIAVPNAEALNRRIGHLAGMLPDMCTLSENDYKLGHRRYYTKQSLIEDCLAAGCNIKKIEGVFLKPITTDQFLKLDFSEELLGAYCKVGREYPELCLGILMEACLK